MTDHVTNRRRHPTNSLYMNPDDLEELGVTCNDAVCVTSDSGSLFAYPSPDANMRRGVVSMTHCWSAGPNSTSLKTSGSHTGRLVSLSNNVQTINRMPRQSAIPVGITIIGTPRS
jgi:anaerobic selenocysteine-containing dehydrogenase